MPIRRPTAGARWRSAVLEDIATSPRWTSLAARCVSLPRVTSSHRMRGRAGRQTDAPSPLPSQGYDVRRLATAAPIPESGSSPLLDLRLSPIVIERSSSVRVFGTSPLSPLQSYHFGPRTTRWIPGATVSAEGQAVTLGL